MTTREIYFKNVVLSDQPVGRIGYVYKDKDGRIQVSRNTCLELRTDEYTVERSIRVMKDIENSEGFMFWNYSPEGEEFLKEVSEALSKNYSKLKT